MAALHDALQSLSPIAFEDVPSEEAQLKEYLQEIFSKGQVLIDSVPTPPPDLATSTSRPRSNTAASVASNISEMSSSSARAEPLIPAHGLLQKEWGKPVKLSAKENPMGIGVYKLSGKDGRAWFARRSVHEGMPYTKWKNALQREFPESLEVQGAPGEGNIRGIGAERSVTKRVVDGVGALEVYHLSAQFPGPTTPRDFVTLLLTSSAALRQPTSDEVSAVSETNTDRMDFGGVPRHFMVISRPCKHPDCPPRSGFIRGEYESIEFIREVPLKPKRSSSATDLTEVQRSHGGEHSINKEAILRHARNKSGSNGISYSDEELSSAGHSEGRARGRTISFAESRGVTAKGETVDITAKQSNDDEEEMTPVEWIMITRSDPGGSVPRFMVERGTPSSIVADASKFLDWACKKGHLNAEEGPPAASKDMAAELEDKPKVVAQQPKAQPQGVDGTIETLASSSQPLGTPITTETAPSQSNGLLSAVASAAYASLETYAPKAVVDLLPAHQQTPVQSSSTVPNTSPSATRNFVEAPDSDTSSTHSINSYASADSHLSSSSPSVKAGEPCSKSMSISPISSKDKASTTSLPAVDRALAKLAARKASLEDKLRKTREKETQDKETLTSKEETRVKKAEEKHEREVKRAEEKFEKELKALEAKRKKEEEKEQKRREYEEEKERKRKEYEEEKERKRKEAEDEKERKKKEKEAEAGEVAKREKDELLKEIEALRKESSRLKTENETLTDRVGDLQKENTALVAGLGQIDGGQAVLKGLGLNNG